MRHIGKQPMTFLKWLILTPICWAFTLLAMSACWLLPMFAETRIGLSDNGTRMMSEPRLPKWLKWFMTPDNSLLGDQGWKASHSGTYLDMVLWLLRNPAYGFGWSVLAATPPAGSLITTIGDPLVNDQTGHAGWYLSTTQGAFRFRWIVPTIKGHCFMLDVGWCMPVAGLTNGEPLLFYGINPRFPRFNNKE